MLTKIFWTVWIIVSLLLLVTLTTDIEITNRLLIKGLNYIALFGLVKLLNTKLTWTWTKTLLMTTVLFGIFLMFKLFTDLRGDWKTQTIIFQNKHLANRTIESQLQDKGAFGYNRRTIDRVKIIPFISWTKTLTADELENIDSLTWDKVDVYVNEQELKGG